MTELCVKCQAKYFLKRSGVTVIETSGNPPRPVRLWRADLLACPVCSGEIATHFGLEPMMESHEAGFPACLQEARDRRAFVMHHPEFLAMRVFANTVEVRYVHN